MATTTPIRPGQVTVDGAPEREPATAPHDLAVEPYTQSLAFLDHRTRAKTIDRHLAAPGHYLALADGPEERLLPIRERIMHLGRSIAADVRFEENQVSRRHAILARDGHHVRLLDDRSHNGTFVGGGRIVAIDLQEDDVIRLGRLVMRYVRVY